jgi:hypothetical protein
MTSTKVRNAWSYRPILPQLCKAKSLAQRQIYCTSCCFESSRNEIAQHPTAIFKLTQVLVLTKPSRLLLTSSSINSRTHTPRSLCRQWDKATGWTENSWFDSRRGRDFSSSPKCPNELLDPPSLLLNLYPGGFPGGTAVRSLGWPLAYIYWWG